MGELWIFWFSFLFIAKKFWFGFCAHIFDFLGGFISQNYDGRIIFKRPGEAGAVLQTPLLLINSFIHWVLLCGNIFKTLSLPNRKS